MSELEQKILKNHPPEAFLKEKFHSLGFDQLTDIQKKAIPIACQKIDSLIIAPTGSGKTECSVIPTFSQIKETFFSKNCSFFEYSNEKRSVTLSIINKE